jgi:lysozyme family protein
MHKLVFNKRATMANFLLAWPSIIGDERMVVTDDPDDSGGYSVAGIAENKHPHLPLFAKAGAMGLKGGDKVPDELLPDIQEFYKSEYWDQIWGDQINDQDVATKLVHAAEQQGTPAAMNEIQEACGVTATGHMNSETLNALNS